MEVLHLLTPKGVSDDIEDIGKRREWFSEDKKFIGTSLKALIDPQEDSYRTALNHDFKLIQETLHIESENRISSSDALAQLLLLTDKPKQQSATADALRLAVSQCESTSSGSANLKTRLDTLVRSIQPAPPSPAGDPPGVKNFTAPASPLGGPPGLEFTAPAPPLSDPPGVSSRVRAAALASDRRRRGEDADAASPKPPPGQPPDVHLQ